MKTISALLAFVLTAGSCQNRQALSLQAPTNRDVYSVVVDDAAEAELLRDQLKLEIVQILMPNVYFLADGEAVVSQLQALGYAEVRKQNPDDVYRLYGKITGEYKADVISRAGAIVITQEKDFIIVYGTITALKALQREGYALWQPDDGIRPREIQVTVKSQPDVQRIYTMGVDIFTAVPDGNGGFTIHGSAFDFQIDSIKRMNYEVTLLKSKL